jgi:hypothetical protein
MSWVLPQVYMGYGLGYRLLYPPKTYTHRQVSNSTRNCERLPIVSTTATTNHHENMSRIVKKGNGWHIYPFPQKVCYLLDTIMTNSDCFPHPTTLKNKCVCSFLMVVGCSSPPPFHHPRKWVNMLVFDGGWLSFITTIPPLLKMSMHAHF